MLQLTGEDPQIHQSAVIQSMQSWSKNFLRWIFGLKKLTLFIFHCLPWFSEECFGTEPRTYSFFPLQFAWFCRPWIWIWSLFVPHISCAHDCLATGQDHGQIWYTNWCLRAVDTWCLFIHVFDFCLFLMICELWESYFVERFWLEC